MMKTNLSTINRDIFRLTTGEIAGEECTLVTPLENWSGWNKENLIFRSSIWNSEGELISAGFPKFFNWNESSHICPEPTDIRKCEVVEKIDGSLLILSRYKGELICRTRNSFDTLFMQSHSDIKVLKEKYPLVFNLNMDDVSYLYEWTTPNNIIVLNYGPEPELKLVGLVHHKDYSLARQKELDLIAESLEVGRPKWYSFSSLEDMILDVSLMENKEGVCCYYNNGQSIKKVKSLDYLKRHAFKSNICLETALDLYLNWGEPSYLDAMSLLVKEFDFECGQIATPFISKVVDAKKEVDKIIQSFKSTVNEVKCMIRKDAARIIVQKYGDTNRAGFVFSLLDNKPIDRDGIKKLYYQVLKGR